MQFIKKTGNLKHGFRKTFTIRRFTIYYFSQCTTIQPIVSCKLDNRKLVHSLTKGINTSKRLPFPGSLCTVIFPRLASNTAFT